MNICTDDIINRNDDVNENDDVSCRRNRHKCISGNTALTRAVGSRHVECALSLIKAGAEVNVYRTKYIQQLQL